MKPVFAQATRLVSSGESATDHPVEVGYDSGSYCPPAGLKLVTISSQSAKDRVSGAHRVVQLSGEGCFSASAVACFRVIADAETPTRKISLVGYLATITQWWRPSLGGLQGKI